MPTYASALRAAEQIEQAHQAAGLTLESQNQRTGYLSPSRPKESQSKGPLSRIITSAIHNCHELDIQEHQLLLTH